MRVNYLTEWQHDAPGWINAEGAALKQKNIPSIRGNPALGEGSGDHRFDLAVCAGHLTGWQGVLTPPSIAFSPSAGRS